MERNLFALFDAARAGVDIIGAKEISSGHDSLYRGKSEQYLANVAPYLFNFDSETGFFKWYMNNGWGNSWGILIFSDFELKTLVKHFRHFLMVKNEDGEQLYFRFYDPRVLRVFLPSCDSRQLNDFFGPIDYFICEDEDPADGLAFSLDKGNLKIDKIKNHEVMTFHAEIRKKRFWIF